MKQSAVILSTFFLFTICSSLPPPTSALPVICKYNDTTVVDLRVIPCPGERNDLYRNSSVIWTGDIATEGLYLSDTVSAGGFYQYYVKNYEWNEQSEQWDLIGTSDPVPVNTAYVEGALYNSPAWQAEYGRGPVVWDAAGGPYRVRQLSIESGILEIDEASVVFSDDGYGNTGWIYVSPGAGFHADGAAFLIASGADPADDYQITFSSLTEAAEPLIEWSTLRETDICLEDCANAEISNNTFFEDPILLCTGSGSGVTIRDNEGIGQLGLEYNNCTITRNRIDEIHVSGQENEISLNTSHLIQLHTAATDNEVINNSIMGGGRIECQSDDNRFVHNTLDAADIYVNNGDGNTFELNSIQRGYITFINVEDTFITGNTISDSYTDSIILLGSHFNTIEENRIHRNNQFDGIQLGSDNGSELHSNYNIIRSNHIWDCWGEGIHIAEGGHNQVYDNISEQCGHGIYLGAGASNNLVYNNLFRTNNVNGFDEGADNQWSEDKMLLTPGHNIVGGPYRGGNYWSEYTGPDQDGDKLGDISHPIPTVLIFTPVDFYPLIWVGMPSPSPTVTPGPTPDPENYPQVDSGDYDGSGDSDIAVFREDSGLWAVRGMTRCYFGQFGDVPVSGDYDGDGTADISVFRGGTGLWAVRGITRFYFGGGSDITVPGDYDGDGCCGAAVFQRGNGLWAIRGETRIYFGAEGDWPVPARFGDGGRKKIAVFRPATGLWAVKDFTRCYFGIVGDLPVPCLPAGGQAQPAVFRPPTGLWAVRGVTRVYFGSYWDQPVPADFDGVSGDEIAVFDDSNGLWAVRGMTRVYHGAPGDLPATR